MKGYTNFHRKLARSQRVIDSYMLLLLIVSNKTERERERERPTQRQTERDRERENPGLTTLLPTNLIFRFFLQSPLNVHVA